MRIDLMTPTYQITPVQVAKPDSGSPAAASGSAPSSESAAASGATGAITIKGPAATVEISPEGRAAYEAGVASRANAPGGITECETCANRKYVDSSNDAAVSYQTPAHIDPGAAMSAVASHESEHVSNDRAKAESEGRVVVSQSVSYQTSICPECGRVYVSGGEARTVTASSGGGGSQAANESGGIYNNNGRSVNGADRKSVLDMVA
jgi:hypothetical protein